MRRSWTYSARSAGAATLCAPVRWCRLSEPSPAACRTTGWTCRNPASARDSRPARPCSQTWWRRGVRLVVCVMDKKIAFISAHNSIKLRGPPPPPHPPPPPLPLFLLLLDTADFVPLRPAPESWIISMRHGFFWILMAFSVLVASCLQSAQARTPPPTPSVPRYRQQAAQRAGWRILLSS